MLHVNDDSNDELFRRAADSYPLKTGGADWNAVLAKMSEEENDPKPAIIPRKRNYRFLWLLLLLIPLGIYELQYKEISKRFTPRTDQQIKTTSADEQAKIGQPGNAAASTAASNMPVTGTHLSTTPSTNLIIGASGDKSLYPASILSQASGELSIQVDPNGEQYTKPKNSRTSKQKFNTRISNAEPTEDDVAVTNPTNDHQDRKAKFEPASTEIQVQQPGTGTDPALDKRTPDSATEATTTPAVPVKETKDAETKISSTQDKKDKNDNRRAKHFYLGLVAGPDFSTVKLQSVKKAGLNYGFVAGYRISKSFSVETGLQKDRKYYHTDGQYFNTKAIYLPPNAYIESVDGQCNMLELPVNLRYVFLQRPASNWFAAAGVSSYFMQDESYIYDVSRNGYRYPYPAKYDKKSSSLFAVINISAGYQVKLGRIGDLRIEPYFKLPINKLGTGKLPIQSAGITVGFVKDIF